MEQKAGIIDRVSRVLKLKPAHEVKAVPSGKTTARAAAKPGSGKKTAKKTLKAKKK
jgi:hypothetical protein